jgi:glyoxylase-like metal-dependent hydrolase (beta-lactamase superfamily II)
MAADPLQLSSSVWYLPGSVNTFIVNTGDGGALLIDTGQDKAYGRNLRRACETPGLQPRHIINTHAHADHFGGNAYLLRQFPELTVHAPAIERELMASPYLEPVYLFHGASPPRELTGKWTQADPSPVHVTLQPGQQLLAGVELEVFDTSGHAHRHCSILVDGVLLAADALLGPELLERYPLPFGQDIGRQLASTELLEVLAAERPPAVTVPGHGSSTADLQQLAAQNGAAIRHALGIIQEIVSSGSPAGLGTETVLAHTCTALNLTVADPVRYHLNFCTVSAYLSCLRAQGTIDFRLHDNRLVWHDSTA